MPDIIRLLFKATGIEISLLEEFITLRWKSHHEQSHFQWIRLGDYKLIEFLDNPI